MTQIITILNQKGGCGKTTTAVNLGAALTFFDKKVLLIDMDPQGNATTSLGIAKNEIGNSIATLLTKKCTIDEVIYDTNTENLDAIPSNIKLSSAETELRQLMVYHPILSKALAELDVEYDYIFIDAPPSLGVLTLNALYACSSILIPVQAEYYALEGMADLLDTINDVESMLESPCPIKGVLMTLYDARTKLAKDVLSEVSEFFENKGDYVFETRIPRNVKLAEAPSYRKPCIIYEPECAGTKAYLQLAEELLNLEEED